MADEKWRDITFNIPSLLPLQAVPQEPDPGKMLQYLQALHNYLADDRQKISRAINVIAYYRNLFGIDEDQPPSSNSRSFYISTDTAEAFIDTSDKSGTPRWEPLRTTLLRVFDSEPPDDYLANGEAAFWFVEV